MANPADKMTVDELFVHRIGNTTFALGTGLSTLRGRASKIEDATPLIEVLDDLDQCVVSLKDRLQEVKDRLAGGS